MRPNSLAAVMPAKGIPTGNGRLREHAAPLASALRRWWQAYRENRSRRATAQLLHSLDDRMLADIGFDRSEINSVVFGRYFERVRHYDPPRRRSGRS